MTGFSKNYFDEVDNIIHKRAGQSLLFGSCHTRETWRETRRQRIPSNMSARRLEPWRKSTRRISVSLSQNHPIPRAIAHNWNPPVTPAGSRLKHHAT